MPGQWTWQTTLQPSDQDDTGTMGPLHDPVLHAAWLRDANFNGLHPRDEASAQANNLVFGGYSDWRLPTTPDTGKSGCQRSSGGTACGYVVQTQGALRTFREMEHRFSVAPGSTPC